MFNLKKGEVGMVFTNNCTHHQGAAASHLQFIFNPLQFLEELMVAGNCLT